MSAELTRDDVRDILTDWRSHEWQVQGFGMVRTYLDGPGEPRLQVWDQRLACWGNNAIHDHPWAFSSTIYAGTVFNQRFRVDLNGDRPNGHTTQIKPGVRGGQLSEAPRQACKLTPDPIEVWSMGESYRQTHREMHLTRYLPGTVTLITRTDREGADLARIAWYGDRDDQPPFINPSEATEADTERVIGDALERWWLP